MNTLEHLKKHAEFYAPIIVTGKLISHRRRMRLGTLVLYVLTGLLVVALIAPDTAGVQPGIVVLASIWLMFFMMESFYYSYYFASETNILEGDHPHNPITYELAEVVYNCNPRYITQSFLHSRLGTEVLARLNVNENEIDDFFAHRKSPLTSGMFLMKDITSLSLGDFAHAVIEADTELDRFLMNKNISKADFAGAASWVERMHRKRKISERWWGIDQLSRIKGLGKNWSYGNTYILDKYATDIAQLYNLRDALISFDLYKDEIDSLEAVLAKNYEANALLVADFGVPKIEVVAGLVRRIFDGSVLGPLEHKKIYTVDTELLISQNPTKESFENECIRMLEESEKAGNIIILFDDVPAFIAGAFAVGTDLPSFLDDYIKSNRLQVIGMADKSGFDKIIRPNEKMMTRFEPIIVHQVGTEILIRLLQDRVIPVEKKYKIYFTYHSLRAMVETVDRYFTEGTLEDKVSDFLSEITPRMVLHKKRIVEAQDIYTMVTDKTGIPVGVADDDEKQTLSNLESILSKYVIGQKEALSVISNAMRRNRSGISSGTKPIGTFLFLGPTGVGKTETSKALARAVFGDSKKLLRLDMSEYNTPDSLNRLIGTVGGGTGVLATLIREHRYGVLLLDEFEKTDIAVQNLFLQIFDEGMFSDATGHKVNARNIIFIATSNAGSDLIWDYVQAGQNLSDKKSEIVDAIIHRDIFKPELINRFDSVVLFSPLSADNLKDIAHIMLEGLKRRVREQGIEFEITPGVIDFLVAKGTDPEFGARPLNRAIQDTIESDIADKMMRGELVPGMTYTYPQE